MSACPQVYIVGLGLMVLGRGAVSYAPVIRMLAPRWFQLGCFAKSAALLPRTMGGAGWPCWDEYIAEAMQVVVCQGEAKS